MRGRALQIILMIGLLGCGRTPAEGVSGLKVVGGEAVAPGAFPAVVGLAFGDPGSTELSGECTGTLIAATVVLTAGHCLKSGGFDAEKLGPAIKDRLKIYTGDGSDGSRVDAATGLGVVSAKVYPTLRRDPLGYGDFGLVFLEKEMTGVDAVPLVSTLAGKLAALESAKSTLVGYGRRDDGNAGRKFQAEAVIHASNPAEAVIGGEGRDACSGDSGGPALVTRADGSQAQLGVVSRGLGLSCGPGGYTGLVAEPVCWLAEAAGLEAPPECITPVPHYSAAELARIDVYRLCAGKGANPSQRLTIEHLSTGLGAKSCRDLATRLSTATTLKLDGFMLADLSPLAQLTKLESLSLTGNLVTDVSPLLLLTHLKTLSIDGNDVQDVDALAPLESPRGSDRLLVLGKHRQLRNYAATPFLHFCLDQSTNPAARRTIQAVFWTTMAEDCNQANERLIGMTSLTLKDRGLTDLTPLADLTTLKSLDLAGNPIADVTPLAGLENLARLDVSRTTLADLAPLAPLVARGLVIVSQAP